MTSAAWITRPGTQSGPSHLPKRGRQASGGSEPRNSAGTAGQPRFPDQPGRAGALPSPRLGSHGGAPDLADCSRTRNKSPSLWQRDAARRQDRSAQRLAAVHSRTRSCGTMGHTPSGRHQKPAAPRPAPPRIRLAGPGPSPGRCIKPGEPGAPHRAEGPKGRPGSFRLARGPHFDRSLGKDLPMEPCLVLGARAPCRAQGNTIPR